MNLKLIHVRKETYHTKICTGEKTQLVVREEAWVPVLILPSTPVTLSLSYTLQGSRSLSMKRRRCNETGEGALVLHSFYCAPKYNHNHSPKILRSFSLVISLVK